MGRLVAARASAHALALRNWKRAVGMSLILVAGCAPAGPAPAAPSGGPEAQTPGRPRHLSLAIMGNPSALNVNVGGLTGYAPAGTAEVERLVNGGLVVVADDGLPRPELAQEVPSLENGLWKLLPDGGMEIIYRIKPEARWHDGTPFTAEDVAFSARVLQDQELGLSRDLAFRLIQGVEAPEPSTAIVKWKQPYIEADTLFTSSLMPQHLLGRTYQDDKANLVRLAYWSQEYVGTGPYKLREFVEGSHLVLEAFDGYILGQPKIGRVEVRFIEDRNTLIANLLGGEVDMSLGRGISLEQALLVRDQWKEGKADFSFKSWMVIYPQFIDPNPPVIADVRFRKALMHAIDRQQMVDSIQHGLVPVAHSMLTPQDPDYEPTLDSVVRYQYDPQKALQLMAEVGYTRGADGSLRDTAGQKLALEYRTMDGYDIHLKTIFPVIDFWQRIGVTAEAVVFPQLQAREREWLYTYPGFLMYRQPNTLSSLRRHHSRNIPLPENRFVGSNYARYSNPDYDALIDRYFVSIPREERLEVGRQLLRHNSDRLPMMGLFYDTEPVLVSNRVSNVTVRIAPGTNQAWNAHQWTVK